MRNLITPVFIGALLLLTQIGLASASGDAQDKPGFHNIIFQALNLAILLGVLVHFFKTPVKRAIAGRSALVAKDIDEAGRLLAEAQARLQLYEARLSAFAAESEAMLLDFRRQGELERDRLIADAEADAERVRREAERTAQSEIDRAKARLEAEIVRLSVEAAGRLVREKMGPADHRRLVGEYLARLEERS